MADPEKTIGSERSLVGILALLAAERDDRVAASGEGRRSEIIMSDAGLTIAEIAQVTGRKYETVKTAIRRARTRGKPAADGADNE